MSDLRRPGSDSAVVQEQHFPHSLSLWDAFKRLRCVLDVALTQSRAALDRHLPSTVAYIENDHANIHWR